MAYVRSRPKARKVVEVFLPLPVAPAFCHTETTCQWAGFAAVRGAFDGGAGLEGACRL